MKKLVFLLAVAFSAALYSCGNKAEGTTETTDTIATEEAAPVVVEEVDAAVDSVGDTLVVAAEEVAAPAAE
ncbi:MAG: hypothetical protein NC342_04695 [Pseudoflavonifractor sp.]|nr:hypothetical protein [Alloprevotella sp.]MCM1116816.1 hypothetical protein [Pseudoflavonifractor sp.]